MMTLEQQHGRVAVRLVGNSVQVRFRYDSDLVARIREVPGRRWDGETKVWTVPKPQWRTFTKLFGNIEVELSSEDAEVLAELEKPVKPIREVNGFTGTLYPFQAEAVGFLVTRQRCLLADEMGLGKTISTIAAAIELRSRDITKHVLVFCPKTILPQWIGEIKRFTGEHATAIAGDRIQRGKARDQAYGTFFAVTNYETVLNEAEKLAELKPDIVVLDEAQRIGTYDAKTTERIKEYFEPNYRWALTGTPLENALVELYSIFDWIDYDILGPWKQFKTHHLVYGGYRGKQVVGHKDLPALHEQIRNYMLRRHKREVLADLPSVTSNNYYVFLSKVERETYNIIRKDLEKYYRLFRASRGETGSGEVLARLTYLRECCDHQKLVSDKDESSKLDELLEIIEELGDDKTVIFTEYEQMLHLIAEKLQIGHAELFGAMDQQQRIQSISAFNDDPDCRIFLSTEAGGLGVNLQVASVLVNFELHWNPARLQQRIGRLHRIGQKSTVTCINLVARDTVEEKVLEVINDKSDLFRNVVDGDFSSIDHERAVWKILDAEFKDSRRGEA